MTFRRLLTGTVLAATTLSAAGLVIFGVLLPGFYSDFLDAGTATGVAREPILWWAIVVAMLAYGALIAVVVDIGPAPIAVRTAMTRGAVVSFLMWLAADFALYGISNVGNVIGLLIEPPLEAAAGALAGAVVVLVNGSGARRTRRAVGRAA